MIEFKAGSMFIDIDGEMCELHNIPEFETLEPDFPDDPNYIAIKQFISPGSFTATMKLSKQHWLRMIDITTGLFKMICELCPNKRVVYLAKYGKGHRTQKKNRTRAIRILEKEARNR